MPDSQFDLKSAGKGVLSRWPAPLACFRPELAGFSDHSASVNCHMSLADSIEVVTHTRSLVNGPDILELAKFTAEKALLYGGGYGYWRKL